MGYIVEMTCKACNGTGDWRGKKGLPDDPSLHWLSGGDNNCRHCNGTGIQKIEYPNLCKYCMTPCFGFCCKSCYEDFEEEKYEEDVNES